MTHAEQRGTSSPEQYQELKALASAAEQDPRLFSALAETRIDELSALLEGLGFSGKEVWREICFATNNNIEDYLAEFAKNQKATLMQTKLGKLSEVFPEFAAKISRVLEAKLTLASNENLYATAGGSSIGKNLGKTWTTSSERSKKERAECVAIDATEAVVGLAALGLVAFGANKLYRHITTQRPERVQNLVERHPERQEAALGNRDGLRDLPQALGSDLGSVRQDIVHSSRSVVSKSANGLEDLEQYANSDQEWAARLKDLRESNLPDEFIKESYHQYLSSLASEAIPYDGTNINVKGTGNQNKVSGNVVSGDDAEWRETEGVLRKEGRSENFIAESKAEFIRSRVKPAESAFFEEKYGLELVKIRDDGNCFYTSLIDQLKHQGITRLTRGSQEVEITPTELRKLAVEHMKINEQNDDIPYKWFNESMGAIESHNFPQAHLRDGEFADSNIISSLGRELGINYTLIDHNPKEQPKHFRFSDDGPHIFLHFNEAHRHYNSLRPGKGKKNDISTLKEKMNGEELSRDKFISTGSSLQLNNVERRARLDIRRSNIGADVRSDVGQWQEPDQKTKPVNRDSRIPDIERGEINPMTPTIAKADSASKITEHAVDHSVDHIERTVKQEGSDLLKTTEAEAESAIKTSERKMESLDEGVANLEDI